MKIRLLNSSHALWMALALSGCQGTSTEGEDPYRAKFLSALDGIIQKVNVTNQESGRRGIQRVIPRSGGLSAREELDACRRYLAGVSRDHENFRQFATVTLRCSLKIGNYRGLVAAFVARGSDSDVSQRLEYLGDWGGTTPFERRGPSLSMRERRGE